MPLPFFFNQWACNQWAAEPDRDAAMSQETFGNLFPPVSEVPGPDPLGESIVETDAAYSREDWFKSLMEAWEPKSAVIPPEKHVSGAMNPEVLAFVNGVLTSQGKNPRTELACFHRAWYQLRVAGFGVTGPPSKDSNNFQILIEHRQPDGSLRQEVQEAAAMEAVLYIRGAILRGVPVLVGICLKNRAKRDNEVQSTPFTEPQNHYVVIVGMGEDEHGAYFAYYNYWHAPKDSDRFYVKPSVTLERLDGKAIVAEVRRTVIF